MSITASQGEAGLRPGTVVEVDPAEQAEIERAQAGDWLAWEALVGRYQETVFRLAYLIVGDAADAQDVAQEAFIQAYKALPRFQLERPLRPWLLQITRNQARNRRRAIGRYWAAIRRFVEQRPEEPAEAIGLAKDDAQQLQQALSELRPEAAEIIYLRYFLELSVAETAQTLNVKPGTVKSRLHRALGSLRERIESDFPELAS